MNDREPESSATPGSRIALLGFLLIAALGAVLRLYDLDHRVMHGDEANQAIKTAILLEEGRYEYDPVEHHGPTLYYIAAAVSRILGHETRDNMTESALRLVPALFGAATILLLWLVRDALGTPATMFSALLLALSPALTFYSRYYIQESLLVFFTFAALACGWRLDRKPSALWALLTGASIGFMHAAKETALITAVAIVGAGVVTFVIVRPTESVKRTHMLRHAALASAAAVGVSVAFFSSFGTHWPGVLDSILTYGNYLGKGSAEASLHTHPWYFYLHRLAWYHRSQGPYWTEAFILGGALLGVAWTARNTLRRAPGSDPTPTVPLAAFFTLYAGALLFAYSVLPYKTPWNLIQFHAPLCVVAGIGLAALWNAPQAHTTRAVLALIVAAGASHLAWQNHKANFEYAAYPGNPYVYGHTSTAITRLADRVDTVADNHPDGNALLIAVIQPDGDYWPLPWYLRTYERVGYWRSVPDPIPPAAIVIAPTSLTNEVWPSLEDDYAYETHGLRPGILRVMYVRQY